MEKYDLTAERADARTLELHMDGLSEHDKEEVQKLSDEITFDYEAISSFGKGVTKKITEASSQILDTVMLKDAPEVESMLMMLTGEMDKFNMDTLSEKKQNMFQRMFGGKKPKDLITRYKSISGVIDDVKEQLEKAAYQLRKDIMMDEAYLEDNREYIRDLDKHILAAEIRIRKEQDEIDKQKNALDKSDEYMVQEIAMRESELRALGNKVFNLRLQRAIAVQNIPKLLMLKEGDAVLVSKIEDGINQIVPLWESQIVIGIQAQRQLTGAQLSKNMTDMTNMLLKHNAETLKESAISVAQENERAIVDTEAIVESTNTVIETIRGIHQASVDGAAKREQGIAALSEIYGKLSQAMIESKQNHMPRKAICRNNGTT